MQNGVTVIRESRGAKDAYELRAADLFYVSRTTTAARSFYVC